MAARMAAAAGPGWQEFRAPAWIVGPLQRTAGVALLTFAVLAGAALAGFDARDPSLNHATAAPVSNPLGAAGAVAADLLYQFFGLAAWLLVLVPAAWGVRLALRRPFPWAWLPPLALPLALMAFAGFLAVLPHPGRELWPLGTGLGGLVGHVLWDRLELRLGGTLYFVAALVCAAALTLAALGVRWGEGVWAAGRVGATAAWAGRRLNHAARQAGAASGQGSGDDADRREPARRPSGLKASLRAAAGGVVGQAKALLRRLRPGAEVDDPDGSADAGASAPAPQGVAATTARMRPRSVRPPVATAEIEDEEPEALAVPPAPRNPPTPRTTPLPRTEATPVPPADAGDGYELPALDLLAPVKVIGQAGLTKEALAETSRQLETVLDDFGVRGQITDARPGPVVTLYELEPAPGTRAARVISLADDIARSLCALSVRVAVVPGRNVIGIELPNERRETVYLRDLLQSETYERSSARLPLALGKDIAGVSVVVDLARMPHLLIAGTTGSGKSVAINTMLLSLLYRLRPEELRLILIDPKVIELSVYEDIPHLLAPVVTEPHKAVVALKWVVRQMDERYRLMSHLGVRDIFAFNKRILQAQARGEELKRRVRTGFEPGTGAPIIEELPIDNRTLPLIVVVVDEVADLMMTAGKEIENAIQRLSQKARAAGVHLVVATQRPSVDVLTGVIKANLPSRISFRVSSKIDSRTILGEPGAEQLLGQGDMLHLMPGDRISRIHGPLVTDAEVEQVVRHLKAQGEPDYHDEVTSEAAAGGEEGGAAEGPGPAGGLFADPSGASGDAIYNQAVQVVLKDGKASTSYLQRKLAIGYNSAAKLIERMENEGVISHADHVGRRQVLMGRGGVDGTEPTDHF
jgi:S-DNA-T family DNA segregation ATPase FtsK/SpoIIIE